MHANVSNIKHNMISKTDLGEICGGSGLEGWAHFPLGNKGERHRCLHKLRMTNCLRKRNAPVKSSTTVRLHPIELLDFFAGVNQHVNQHRI